MTRMPALMLCAALAACAAKPPVPEWQMNAHGAIERYTQAYLSGNSRAADAEFAKARSELASTGDATLVARAELTRCAMQVASLVFEPCAGFERLRADAPAAEQAYASYLAGSATAADAALLPAQHRGAVAQPAGAAAIEDPMARLVAAGVVLRTGRASPELMQAAVDTASKQGWRRPLLAWLGAQAQRAEQAGAADEAARLRRRIALATDEIK